MRFSLAIAVALLFACEPQAPVRCSGPRNISCHCVFSCDVTDAGEVLVTHDGFCEPLCTSSP